MLVIDTLKAITCPLCHGNDARPWGSENGFTAVKCRGCGLVYVNPRPRLEDISEANKIGEHRTEAGVLNVVFRCSKRKIAHYGRIIARMFGPELREGRPLSWLDVGAGYGEVVEAVRQILPAGSRVEGIEPMEAKARQAQAAGLPIATTPLAEVDERYDVVSLINVFSHLPDFDLFASDLKLVLKEGGKLFIETGNAGDLDSAADYPDRLFLPDHVVFAGGNQLRSFLARNGFGILTTHERRLDTVTFVARNAVKRLLGREVKLTLPHTSPFRTVFYKAQLRQD
jgi:2-polyprenyl-3-methyl-5-hydroxy-6-metoxy-1,4-benzoquinol methylase